MSEPWIYPDNTHTSTCCDAPELAGDREHWAICQSCGEWAEHLTEAEHNQREAELWK